MTQESTPPVRFPPTGRVPELDGIRGLAILLVLVYHAFVFAKPAPGSWLAYPVRMAGFGWSGVDLFFVLSGFLIGGILMDQRGAPAYYRAFYTRRLCRIFPLYFLVLLLFALPIVLGLTTTDVLAPLYEADRLPFWQYALMVQNIGTAIRESWASPFLIPTWSLAIEEQFYLILPLIIHRLSPRAVPWVVVAFIVSSPVLRGLLYAVGSKHTLTSYLLLPCRWDALFIGVGAAWLLRRPTAADRIVRHRRRLYTATGLAAVGVAAIAAINPSPRAPLMSVVGLSVVAIFYGLVLLTVLHAPSGRLRRAARARPLRWLGDVSYAAYLFQFPLMVLCSTQAPSQSFGTQLGAMSVAIALTLLLAWLSTRWFERPFIRLGHRVRYHGPRQGGDIG